MATFRCSVIVGKKRFVNRLPYDALCFYHAYLKVKSDYNVLSRFGVKYLIEYAGKSAYYDLDGNRLT